jgi:hypothetical protein
LDRGTPIKELNVSSPEYVYLKVLKLLHRLEIPEDKKNAKVIEKNKILLKNVLSVVDEERLKLNRKTSEVYKNARSNASSKIGDIFNRVLSLLKCPKKND